MIITNQCYKKIVSFGDKNQVSHQPWQHFFLHFLYWDLVRLFHPKIKF